MTSIPPELLKLLRERYTAAVVPPCRVCGAKLIPVAGGMGGSTIYQCSRIYALGRSEWTKTHEQDSRWITQSRSIDPDVIRLIDLIEGVDP